MRLPEIEVIFIITATQRTNDKGTCVPTVGVDCERVMQLYDQLLLTVDCKHTENKQINTQHTAQPTTQNTTPQHNTRKGNRNLRNALVQQGAVRAREIVVVGVVDQLGRDGLDGEKACDM